MKDNQEKLSVHVYSDAVSPAAKAVGQSLESVVRTCLRPVDGVVWSVNQAMNWIANRLTQLFTVDGTKSNTIEKPSLELEGRIVQHIQIVGPTGDKVLCGLFIALLANGMQGKESVSNHPALADVLRSLMPSEARLFAAIYSYRKCIVNIHECRAHWVLRPLPHNKWLGSMPQKTGMAEVDDQIDPHIEMEVEPLWDKLDTSFSPKLGTYNLLANMVRLGIVKIYEVNESERLIMDPAGRTYSNELHQWREKLKHLSENIAPWCVGQEKDWKAEVNEMFRAVVVELTPWGELLGQSCRSNEFFDGKNIVIPDWAID